MVSHSNFKGIHNCFKILLEDYVLAAVLSLTQVINRQDTFTTQIETVVYLIHTCTIDTLVSMGPGEMALNLIPYFAHSAASDLRTFIHTESVTMTTFQHLCIGNSLKKQESLYKVLTPSIKPLI